MSWASPHPALAQDILVLQCHQVLPQQHHRRTSLHPPTALPGSGPSHSMPTSQPCLCHPHSPTWPFRGYVWPCFPSPGLGWPWSPTMGWCLAHIPTNVPNAPGWGMSSSTSQFRTGRAQDHIQTSFEFLQVGTHFILFLSNVFQCLTTHMLKKLFTVQVGFMGFFQCAPTAACSVSGHQWERSVYDFFNLPRQIFHRLIRYPRAFSSFNKHISFSLHHCIRSFNLIF